MLQSVYAYFLFPSYGLPMSQIQDYVINYIIILYYSRRLNLLQTPKNLFEDRIFPPTCSASGIGTRPYCIPSNMAEDPVLPREPRPKVEFVQNCTQLHVNVSENICTFIKC
jgi:hypothetical protein